MSEWPKGWSVVRSFDGAYEAGEREFNEGFASIKAIIQHRPKSPDREYGKAMLRFQYREINEPPILTPGISLPTLADALNAAEALACGRWEGGEG